MQHHHLHYRPHIDGLRAIAVMGVVAFHFGAMWLPGGFLGVDIFFVISGFVISRSIYRDAENGDFSILSFYERRAKRILPALFVVSMATAVAASFFLFPVALSDFAKSLFAAALFSSNIYFYYTSGYFSPTAIQLPLLHYWSLGVEEQFYILFPVVALLAIRHAKRWLPAIVISLLAVSFASCLAVKRVDPTAAFYLFPFRAFEILIGCVLALKQMRFPSNAFVAGACSALGIGLCLASMFFISEATGGIPGTRSLIPCLGAALIIYGGERISSLPSRLLSTPPLLLIGRISFSLYLIHWPIAVFLHQTAPRMGMPAVFIIGVGGSLVLAYLSYRLIEQPVRNTQKTYGAPRVLQVSGAACAMLAAVGVAIVITGGLPQRFDPATRKALEYQKYDYGAMFRVGTCFLEPKQKASQLDIKDCLPASGRRVVIWGDSSVGQYYWGLEPLMKEKGIELGQLTSSGCLPLLNVDNPIRPNCKAFNDLVFATLAKEKPDAVILGGVWSVTKKELAALDDTLRRLQDSGIQVLLIGPPTYYKHSVPIIIASRRQDGDNDDDAEDELRTDVSIDRDNCLYAHARKTAAKYISIAKEVCAGGCKLANGNVPMHFDTMHLTREGSQYYAPRLAQAILQNLK